MKTVEDELARKMSIVIHGTCIHLAPVTEHDLSVQVIF